MVGKGRKGIAGQNLCCDTLQLLQWDEVFEARISFTESAQKNEEPCQMRNVLAFEPSLAAVDWINFPRSFCSAEASAGERRSLNERLNSLILVNTRLDASEHGEGGSRSCNRCRSTDPAPRRFLSLCGVDPR